MKQGNKNYIVYYIINYRSFLLHSPLQERKVNVLKILFSWSRALPEILSAELFRSPHPLYTSAVSTSVQKKSPFKASLKYSFTCVLACKTYKSMHSSEKNIFLAIGGDTSGFPPSEEILPVPCHLWRYFRFPAI